MTNLNQPDSQNDDLTDDLTSSESYGYEMPQKKKFLPWHKPRKQYVREMQWTRLIEGLLSEYYPADKVIKYLGLPGDDLLDLRYFHDTICEPKELKLQFLGFNKGMAPGKAHEASLEISLDEINRLKYVDNKSELIPDDFIQIAGEKSLAWTKSSDMGPFDVINIDLCDSIAKAGVTEFEEDHYKTLNRLMMLQSFRKKPWLLFLTTRTNKNSINEQVFDTLKRVYLDNLNKCKGFSDKSTENFYVSNEVDLNDYCNKENGFSNIFLMGLSKWILGIGVNHNPQSGVEIKNIMGYKVNADANHPDLVSIALQINPIMVAPVDKIGLAHKTAELIDECSKAVEMLDKLASQEDIDQLLKSNTETNNLMIQHSSELLKKARYDTTNYEGWVKIEAEKLDRKNQAQAQATVSEARLKATERSTHDESDFSDKVRLSGLKVVGKIDLETLNRFKKK